MVGLFSACRGEEGGKIGVSDEEEREEGKPGEGVSGVAGLDGGNDDGLEFVSSVELRDSLRKCVYLVFGTSSIMYLQCQFLDSQMSTRALVIVSTSLGLKVSSRQDVKPSVYFAQCWSCFHLTVAPSACHYRAAETKLLQKRPFPR